MTSPLISGAKLLARGKRTYKTISGNVHPIRANKYYYYRGNGAWSEYEGRKGRDYRLRRGPLLVGKGSYKHVHDQFSFKKSRSYPARYVKGR